MPIQLQNASGGLTHAQRNRLIKSTRKLGMVLGETPTVDGLTDSHSPPHRRPSYSSNSTKSSSSESHGRPSLSLARTASSSSSNTQNSRPSLSLPAIPPLPSTVNINVLPPPQPSPTMAEGSNPQQPSTPLSPTFGTLNRDSPFCPDDSELESSRVTNIRRKKMAKLVRTFGENVPPELVTIGHLGVGLTIDASGGIGSSSLRTRRSSQSLTDDASTRRKYGGVDMKRLSTSSLSFSDSSSQRSVPYPAQVQVSNSTAPKMSLSRSNTLHTTTRPWRSTRSGSGVDQSQREQQHQRATSTAGSGTNADRELAFARLTSGVITPSKKKDPPSPRLVVPETHRKGREWSGEWNQMDMQHVVNQLRRLK